MSRGLGAGVLSLGPGWRWVLFVNLRTVRTIFLIDQPVTSSIHRLTAEAARTMVSGLRIESRWW